MIKKSFVFLLMIIFISLSCNFVSAQTKKKKVLRLKAMEVKGRLHKPEAFYILQRSKLNFKGIEMTKSFIPKIIKSVDEEQF